MAPRPIPAYGQVGSQLVNQTLPQFGDPTDTPDAAPTDGLSALQALLGGEFKSPAPAATLPAPGAGVDRNPAIAGAMRTKYGLGPDNGDISQSNLEALDSFVRGGALNDKIAAEEAPFRVQGEYGLQNRALQNQGAADVENTKGQYGLREQALKNQGAEAVAGAKAQGASANNLDDATIGYLADQSARDASTLTKIPIAQRDAVLQRMAQGGHDINSLTNQTRQMSEAANDLLPFVPELQGLAGDLQKRGVFEPGVGSVRNWLAKHGLGSAMGVFATPETTQQTYVDPVTHDSYSYAAHRLHPVDGAPPEIAQAIGKFNTLLGLFQSGLARAHAGARGAGNSEVAARFEQLLPSQGDLGTFLGSLSGADELLQQYAKHTNPNVGTSGGADPYADPNYQPR